MKFLAKIKHRILWRLSKKKRTLRALQILFEATNPLVKKAYDLDTISDSWGDADVQIKGYHLNSIACASIDALCLLKDGSAKEQDDYYKAFKRRRNVYVVAD